MNIIVLTGGLGNQMSQYSFFLKKKNIDKHTYFDISILKHKKEHQGYELNRVFKIKEPCFSYKSVIVIILRKIHTKLEFNNCLFNLLKFLRFHLITESKDLSYYSPNLMTTKGICVYVGYWHTEKYYYDIKEQILNIFKFDINKLNQKSLIYFNYILNTNSISIHIRRGDYINSENNYRFANICTIEYYSKAISFIKKKIDNPTFYIFSDDINWVKANLPLENCHFIDFNKEIDSWQDMCLMSYCKHNIIANSSFSWWAAWLNSNPQKIVISPKKFVNNNYTPDVFPEKWIKL